MHPFWNFCVQVQQVHTFVAQKSKLIDFSFFQVFSTLDSTKSVDFYWISIDSREFPIDWLF